MDGSLYTSRYAGEGQDPFAGRGRISRVARHWTPVSVGVTGYCDTGVAA